MTFSIIAAIAANNVIGKNNKLPWYAPEELEHFYKLINGKPILMGRKTYESIGKPIKNSQNIVLSHDLSLQLPGCKVVDSVAATLDLYHDDVEVMVIGGESIYRQFLPVTNKMYLTFIDHQFDGDAYFPEWQTSEWKIIGEHTAKLGLYSCRFITLKRK